MAKTLIIGFPLIFLQSNWIMLRGQNKFFYNSKAHHARSGFTNLYSIKEFEKKKLIDLSKNFGEDRSYLNSKK